MVALFVFIILVYSLIVIVFILVDTLVIVRVVVVAQSNPLVISWLPLLAEPVLRLPHLIMFLSAKHGIFFLAIVIEYLFLFCLLLLLLEGLNDLCLLLPSLLVLQVVHIKLMLQIVDIGELFDVNVVVSL